MTLGSICDGIGGWQLAAVRSGIKPVWSSEIDSFCQSVTRRHFPKTVQLGDLNQITDAPKVDIITAGTPCFPAGTLVITDKGYMPIEQIIAGDRVLSHTGRWRKVLKTGSSYKETIMLKGFGHPNLETTANHPFWACKKEKVWNNSRRSYDYVLTSPQWLSAGNMCGFFWATPLASEPLPIPVIETSDVRENAPPAMNENFWWFIGRWLGDGWLRNGQRPDRKQGQTWGQIFICCAHSEKNFLEKRLHSLNLKWASTVERTVCKFHTSHIAWARWLVRHFGEKAHGKKIPAWVLSLPKQYRQALLDGYFSADGFQNSKGIYSASTVSKSLALGIRLIAESLGNSSPVYFAKTKPQKIIEGRLVNQHDFYIVRCDEPKKTTKRKEAFGASWGRVRSVVKTGEIKQVFNLEVETDNSYCAENIIVHNCQNLSIAGDRSGLNGEKSSLFFKAVELVRRVKPDFFVWENVTGAFSSNGGNDFKTVLETILGEHVPSPKRWLNAGVVDGSNVHVCWRTLDAQYWGVPQRRKRIFLIADFTGRRAAKILFERKSLPGDSAPCTKSQRQTSARIAFGIGRDAFNQGINAKFKPSIERDLQPPLTARGAAACANNGIIRRLTPVECERLQGLPDNFTEGGSDAQRYKALGNGMAQPCADFILRQISRQLQSRS